MYVFLCVRNVCLSVRTDLLLYVCGGKKTTFGSIYFDVTMGSGIKLRSTQLCGNHFNMLIHLLVPS